MFIILYKYKLDWFKFSYRVPDKIYAIGKTIFSAIVVCILYFITTNLFSMILISISQLEHLLIL